MTDVAVDCGRAGGAPGTVEQPEEALAAGLPPPGQAPTRFGATRFEAATGFDELHALLSSCDMLRERGVASTTPDVETRAAAIDAPPVRDAAPEAFGEEGCWEKYGIWCAWLTRADRRPAPGRAGWPVAFAALTGVGCGLGASAAAVAAGLLGDNARARRFASLCRSSLSILVSGGRRAGEPVFDRLGLVQSERWGLREPGG
mgnify:CR=1 FL=1